MRAQNPELERQIRKQALELLLQKEPYEIGMRDIAQKCDISATAIYHYYKDKETLFRQVSLDCLSDLNNFMQQKINNAKNSKTKLLAAITSFRDWCFQNPRLALFIMSKTVVDPSMSKEQIDKYYTCNRLGQELLEQCINEKIAVSKNSNLDTNIIVYGLWGCIESILLKRADPKYWQKAIMYTDRFIKMSLNQIFVEE